MTTSPNTPDRHDAMTEAAAELDAYLAWEQAAAARRLEVALDRQARQGRRTAAARYLPTRRESFSPKP